MITTEQKNSPEKLSLMPAVTIKNKREQCFERKMLYVNILRPVTVKKHLISGTICSKFSDDRDNFKLKALPGCTFGNIFETKEQRGLFMWIGCFRFV